MAQAQASVRLPAPSESGGARPSMEKTANSCGKGASPSARTLRRDFASFVSSGSVRQPQKPLQVDLARRVVQEVRSADDMAHPLRPIIHDHRQ
jgi:hypothetical protein